jgi:hypothetical protein
MDAQSLAQLQMQHQQSLYMPQQQQQQQKHLFQQNYSFDEQQQPGYYDPNNPAANRLSLLQQAQSHSFNVDMLGLNSTPQQQLEFLQQQQMYQRSLPRRNTLKRSQRLTTDASIDHEDHSLSAAGGGGLPPEFMNLSPQQQQAFLMMRQHQQQQQQFSNNSSTGQDDLLSQQQHMSRQQQAANNMNNISPHSHVTSISHDPHAMMMNQAAQAAYHAEMSMPLPPPPPLPRRKSLPSIIKSAHAFKENETAHSSSELHHHHHRKHQDIYVIENGIRKRVTEKTNSAALNQAARDAAASGEPGDRVLPRIYNYEDDETIELPNKMILESITSLNTPPGGPTTSKRVSMPSIPAYLNPKFANKGTIKKKHWPWSCLILNLLL